MFMYYIMYYININKKNILDIIAPPYWYSITHVWKQTKNKNWCVSLYLFPSLSLCLSPPSLPSLFSLKKFFWCFMFSILRFRFYKLISSTLRASQNYINIACVHLFKKINHKVQSYDQVLRETCYQYRFLKWWLWQHGTRFGRLPFYSFLWVILHAYSLRLNTRVTTSHKVRKHIMNLKITY